MNNKGFTLIELMVAIIVTSTVVVIAYQVFSSSYKSFKDQMTRKENEESVETLFGSLEYNLAFSKGLINSKENVYFFQMQDNSISHLVVEEKNFVWNMNTLFDKDVVDSLNYTLTGSKYDPEEENAPEEIVEMDVDGDGIISAEELDYDGSEDLDFSEASRVKSLSISLRYGPFQRKYESLIYFRNQVDTLDLGENFEEVQDSIIEAIEEFKTQREEQEFEEEYFE